MAKTLRDLVAATVLSKADIGLVGQGVTDKSMSLDILAEFILRLSDQGFKYESISTTTSVSAIEAQQTAYEGDTTAGDIVLTLPFSGPRDGTVVIVTNFTGSNDLTLTYASGVDIVLPPDGWAELVYQGEWQILSNNIQFISKIPTGSAPLQVASTTKVDNLNASLLEGKTVQQIIDTLLPVGSFYVQYPDAASNIDATAFPVSARPATMFGGTWVEQFNTEGVVFQTDGYDGLGRTNGLMADQFELHFHQGYYTNGGGGQTSIGSITSYLSTGAAYQVDTIKEPKTDGVNALRAGTRTSHTNRLAKYWKRTVL